MKKVYKVEGFRVELEIVFVEIKMQKNVLEENSGKCWLTNEISE